MNESKLPNSLVSKETNPCFCHYDPKPPCPRHDSDTESSGGVLCACGAEAIGETVTRRPWCAEHQTVQPKDAPGIRRFARDVLEGGFEGNTFDGADLQELGVKHGLLREVTVTEPCSTDGCACAEVVDFPTTCYRFTEVMQPPKATEQANSRITQEQFSQIVGEMSTYDFVNGTLDVEAVFNGAGVEIV